MLSLLMGMIKHSQITQLNKFAISLQHPKKDVRNGGHFGHEDKRQSFYKLVLSFLMEVARHVQNTQNRKLVIFFQCIKKNRCNCVVFHCDAKHSDISRGSSHFLCYLFFQQILSWSIYNTRSNHLLSILKTKILNMGEIRYDIMVLLFGLISLKTKVNSKKTQIIIS